MTTTASRLNIALNIRNMKATDLHRATGINKSSISQYLAGVVCPKQDRIYLLAKALNVNELWLMGHDVPMERTAVPSSSEEITQADKDLVYAYHNAPKNAQQVVDLTLEPYKPTDIETKVRQIAELLATIDISCTYTDDNGEGKGNFVSMYLKSYKQDGKRIQVNDPILHIDPLESTYERLLPAMRASGSLQQELLDKYLKERFDVELALIKETPYISNNTLINVSKSVVEKRQERDKKDGVVKYGKVGDEVEFEAVK